MESPDHYDDLEPGQDIREVKTVNKTMGIVIGILVAAVIFLLVGVAFLYLAVDTDPNQTSGKESSPKNLIFVLADGMSPASLTYTREMSTFNSQDPSPPLPLDQYLVGHAKTFSANKVITDSAAGATAYSCQQLTNNQMVAITPEGKACATLLEAAKREGFMTGVVTVTRVTHASPAAFTAHVAHRDSEQDIASQQTYNFSLSMDLLMGGGMEEFTARDDGVNLVDVFQEDGVKVITTPDELEELNELPAVGLFAESHLDYELDRMRNEPRTQPSLSEMVAKALELFENDGRKFILFVESGRIDMAAHANDPGAHYWEMNQYMRTVEVLEEFISTNSETAVFFTSDHATGGISTGRRYFNTTYPEYTWFPEVVLRQNQSFEAMTHRLIDGEDLQTVYLEETGINLQQDHPEEYDELMKLTPESNLEYQSALGLPLTSQALVGWTTIGHTGIDINTYRMGVDMPSIKGVQQNYKIGEILAEKMGLVETLDEINEEYQSWNIDLGSRREELGPVYHEDL